MLCLTLPNPPGCEKFPGELGLKHKAMFSSSPKILMSNGEKPDQFELSIFQELLELEMNPDLIVHLENTSFTKVKIDIDSSQKSIIIYVPVLQLKSIQKT